MAKRTFKITPAHEKFCRMYSDTGNATASYLYAFNDVTYGSARELGSKLLTNLDILDLINVYKEENKVKYNITKDKMIAEVLSVIDNCKGGRRTDKANWLKAIEVLNKLSGLYVNNIDITSNGQQIQINLNLNDNE